MSDGNPTNEATQISKATSMAFDKRGLKWRAA